jgi:hypothetical protein
MGLSGAESGSKSELLSLGHAGPSKKPPLLLAGIAFAWLPGKLRKMFDEKCRKGAGGLRTGDLLLSALKSRSVTSGC